jgi:DNA-binding MarR family transcriptional regulator
MEIKIIKEELIGYNISSTFRLAKILFDKKTGKLGLSHSQFLFIISLYENDGLCQDEIAMSVNLDKTSVSRALKKLEKDGFIKKELCKVDNRINKIFLTEKSLKMKEEVFLIFKELNKKIANGIDEEEIKKVIHILGKLRVNIKKEIELG